MPLMPKRVKFRKNQRGVIRSIEKKRKYGGAIKGFANRGNYVAYGDFGLQALESGWLSAESIESARITMTRFVSGEGRYYIRVFPHKSITAIPAETRMGKGKGEPEYWAATVRQGQVMFEIGGLPESAAKDCLARVAYKMPFKCRFVTRRPNI
jgi:large subunit ribosomal protein L16